MRTLCAMVVVAMAGCAHSTGAKDAGAPACRDEIGCEPPLALRSCEAAELEGAVAAQTAVRRLVADDGPAKVLIHGTLSRAMATCTLLDCGSSRCCNACGAGLALSMGEATGSPSNAHHLLLMGEGIGCGGDDTAICCSHREGARVVVAADLHVHGGYDTALYGPSYHAKEATIVCEVPADAPIEAASPLRVPVPKIVCATLDAVTPPDDLRAHAELLRSADASTVGDLRANEIGCLGQSIIARGPAIAPSLLALVEDDVPLAHGDGRATVGDAAAFLLAQVCQVPRSMSASERDRRRFVEAVAQRCLDAP